MVSYENALVYNGDAADLLFAFAADAVAAIEIRFAYSLEAQVERCYRQWEYLLRWAEGAYGEPPGVLYPTVGTGALGDFKAALRDRRPGAYYYDALPDTDGVNTGVILMLGYSVEAEQVVIRLYYYPNNIVAQR